MNVQYEQQGNYLIPCVKTKKQEEIHLGVWANRHKQYLKQSVMTVIFLSFVREKSTKKKQSFFYRN